MKIAIAEAKAQFADLIRRAEAGEAIELTRYGRSVAQIVAVERGAARPLLGAMAGRFEAPDVDAGDAEVQALFDASA
ncbi:MAG: type II toxin-antitoxin system prevent-host-death family antitoxin [Pseudomonadota bacterium]